jgi:hypothetical protein
LLGKELSFLNKHEQPQYDSDVWQMFLKFVEFWETFKPKLIETEVHLFSDELQVAGTCDLIVEIDGELWLLDIKTSNQIHSTYELQTSVYTQCYKECYGKEIQRQGILWLKSTKRGPKKDKMQGKGWEIVESERSQEENLEIFKIVKRLFDLENPDAAPAYESFRTSAKREDI